jgi:hypothetical protein
VTEPKRVAHFMQQNGIEIRKPAHAPRLLFIEMKIACDRLWVHSGRIERVSEYAATTVEGVRIAVIVAAEHKVDVPGWHLIA